MVMTGASGPGFLRRQQRLDTGPLSVGEFPPRQGQEDGQGCGCGPLSGMAGRVAAHGPGLVSPPPVRPAQQKGAPNLIGGQSEREAAHLGHTQRDRL